MSAWPSLWRGRSPGVRRTLQAPGRASACAVRSRRELRQGFALL